MTTFKVHYTRDVDGWEAKGFMKVEAKTPEDAANKVREEIPRAIVTKTKVDRS